VRRPFGHAICRGRKGSVLIGAIERVNEYLREGWSVNKRSKAIGEWEGVCVCV